MKTAVLRCS